MKRKLALLLAAVMAVTALPGTLLHASSSNTIAKAVNAQAKTVLFEPGVLTTTKTGEIKDNTRVEYYVDGTDLKIKFNDTLEANSTITVELQNAVWFYRAKDNSVRTALTTPISDNTLYGQGVAASRTTEAPLGDAIATAIPAAGAKEAEIATYYTNLGYTVNNVLTPGKSGGVAAHVPAATADISITFNANASSGLSTVAEGAEEPGTISVQMNKVIDRTSHMEGTGWPAGSPLRTYKTSNGFGNWNDYNQTYTYTRTVGVATGTGLANKEEINYTMKMTGDQAQAYIAIPGPAEIDDWITVPLAVRTTGTNDFNVVITSGSANISGGTIRIGSSFEGRTEAKTGVITSRDTFGLDPIYLNELRPGSIKKDAQFEIKAPSGYEFAALGSSQVLADVGVYTQLPLKWTTGSSAGKAPTVAGDTHASNSVYEMKFATRRNGETDYSTILFKLKNNSLVQTEVDRGALFFKNLTLVSTDDTDSAVNVDKELKISFRDTGATRSITDQDLVVAKVADYTVMLTRVKDEIPTLISGRLNDPVTVSSAGVYGDDIRDESHRAQTVKFAEKIADAWWSERTSKFTLPEEVTIMKVQFDKLDKFDTATGKESKTKLMLGTNGGGNGVYYNTRKKASNGNVTVKDNTLTLNTLYVQATEKATFEMSLWLSIAATFEGDITLKLDGSAVRDVDSNKDVSVVIAKAVTPVKIVTKVSEVKIGYQYFSVADFDVVENIAGGFLQGEDAYVTITDGISIDMDIAKGFEAKVSDGDLKIKDINVGTVLQMYGNNNNTGRTGGQITFYIDRESTKPSTVSFKNVQVKVNRSVPYSNESNALDRGIDIYVWGPAVAANYYYLGYDYVATSTKDAINSNDTFSSVAGISTKYINVVTLVDNKASDYANVVKVTIGNPVVAVNTDEFTMPVAAYVSTKSNSTMVPVRFVANALGLPEESVKWDAVNSTVTVDTGNNRIVQFQVGNSNYLVNGVSIPMVSPDGLAVACEVTEERAFVPFRALGEAFGINVGWDAATTTATYNAPIVK